MCWGDPWEGPVDPAAVVSVVTRLREMGSDEVSLGDTIGVATAGAVERLLGMMSGLHDVAVHFHDTYGQALANTLTALRSGITTVDSSAGGLGGCPFAKSATGNLATEDLVWMLNGLGIRTGLDLTELVRCSVWVAQQLGRPSPSAVVRALAAEVADA
jgi:hydroxymethylglutaryl-CoA lyase